MKLQILIPQYKETDEVVKPLLDSIAIQQGIDFDNDVGVIIVNDGSDVKLSDSLLNSYPFKIEYYHNEHKGVSATRNVCLNHATADYVMFCDADDMFCNSLGLWAILYNEIQNQGDFDSLVTAFYEETKDSETGKRIYITRGDPQNGGVDSVFVHGKIHRRQYLLDNNIYWNDNLTIHEDSYFNTLCQKLSTNVKYFPVPFYLWKWRDDSVCRHDPKYILKTYNNLLDSNTSLVHQFIERGKEQDAQFSVTAMIFDAFYTMNKSEWINQENKEYRDLTEIRFKKYYMEFKDIYDSIPAQDKLIVQQGVRNRFFSEGLGEETMTLANWLAHIMSLEG